MYFWVAVHRVGCFGIFLLTWSFLAGVVFLPKKRSRSLKNFFVFCFFLSGYEKFILSVSLS
ncbi:hypothetical protein ACNITU_26860, partial [Escherichia coli]